MIIALISRNFYHKSRIYRKLAIFAAFNILKFEFPASQLRDVIKTNFINKSCKNLSKSYKTWFHDIFVNFLLVNCDFREFKEWIVWKTCEFYRISDILGFILVRKSWNMLWIKFWWKRKFDICSLFWFYPFPNTKILNFGHFWSKKFTSSELFHISILKNVVFRLRKWLKFK